MNLVRYNPPVGLQIRQSRIIDITDLLDHHCFKKLAEHYRAQIEEAIGLTFGKKSLGGGVFGCAFKTSDRAKALKLTFDNTEAANAAFLRERQEVSRDDAFRAGFSVVYGVWQFDLTPQDRRELLPAEIGAVHDVFAVLREEVEPLSTSPRRTTDLMLDVEHDMEAFMQAAIRGGEYMQLTSDDNDPRPQDLKRAKVVAEEIKAILTRGARALRAAAAATYAFFEETGVVLADIHAGNVGFRRHRGARDPSDPEKGVGDIVIFDVGFTDSTVDLDAVDKIGK